MSLSSNLYQLQQFDSTLDSARARIEEINLQLEDDAKLKKALQVLALRKDAYQEKLKDFKRTETAVKDHTLKIDQNQKRLYGGAITNPKELEDLQRESESLQKFLLVLEERQLEAMLELEETETLKSKAAETLELVESDLAKLHGSLNKEKKNLEGEILSSQLKKDQFLAVTKIDDLSTYHSIRASSGGIAVTLMVSDSCSACGANIPSAIAQVARSPGKLALCPTCKRILHPA